METWRVDGNAIEIPTREVYRYMGYRGVQPDEAVAARVAVCCSQLVARSTPRSVWTSYPFTLQDGAAPQDKPLPQDETASQDTILSQEEAASQRDPLSQGESHTRNETNPRSETASHGTSSLQNPTGPHASTHLNIGPLSFESRNLGRNLRACSHVVMMAATIGPGVDFLIRRAEAVSMVDAAIYQAAGAAMVEAWCDMVNERIKADMLAQGLYARPRFSPGYGDVPLALQKEFAQVLNLAKNCGISLTDTLLMTPSKSVTAFIGFSPLEERCPLAGCEVCSKYQTCAYHR